MKKLIFTTLFFALFSTTLIFAQTNDKPQFAICGTIDNTITHADLSKCTALIPVTKNLTIKSFTITVWNGTASTKYPCVGNKVSDAAIAALKASTGDTKFMITEVVTKEEAGKQYPDIEMHLK